MISDIEKRLKAAQEEVAEYVRQNIPVEYQWSLGLRCGDERRITTELLTRCKELEEALDPAKMWVKMMDNGRPGLAAMYLDNLEEAIRALKHESKGGTECNS